ncbi:hypothetical protein RIF29_30007 [Crotalaria pallida]|uniref:Uncharacterized protein n=1 Tax=Crotalaria pallida TaxID=3830 RepID=A0AAN9HUD8_CROPI
MKTDLNVCVGSPRRKHSSQDTGVSSNNLAKLRAPTQVASNLIFFHLSYNVVLVVPPSGDRQVVASMHPIVASIRAAVSSQDDFISGMMDEFTTSEGFNPRLLHVHDEVTHTLTFVNPVAEGVEDLFYVVVLGESPAPTKVVKAIFLIAQ